MEIIIELILIFLISSSVAIITTNLIQGHYKYYKKVYNELPYKIMISFREIVHDNNWDFVWFSDNNTFKLIDDVYIYNSWVTLFDPYALYWLIRYKSYARKHFKQLLK